MAKGCVVSYMYSLGFGSEGASEEIPQMDALVTVSRTQVTHDLEGRDDTTIDVSMSLAV